MALIEWITSDKKHHRAILNIKELYSLWGDRTIDILSIKPI